MKRIISFFLFFILIYTRLVGLNWGVPYPMHPDERNMANAIQGLNCQIPNSKFQIPNKFPISNFQFLKECFNPHFFAYGQFPLYLGYLIIQLYHFIFNKVGLPITFEEATMSLRVISAVASVINMIVLLKIVGLITPLNSKSNAKSQKLPFKVKTFNFKDTLITNYELVITLLVLTFTPYFIQFSHFGTTESLLMLFYSLIIYYSLQLFNKLKPKTIFFLSLFSGLAIATKVSAVIFVFVPVGAMLASKSKIFAKSRSPSGGKNQKLKFQSKIKKLKTTFFLYYPLSIIRYLIIFLLLTGFFALVFSPHNLISFPEFLGTLNYESAVALGKIKVFYTRQFEMTIPILFQLTKIFPYALGWSGLILSFLGFLSNLRDRRINLLRFAFLIYFLPNAFLYVKWTRFIAPIFPIMTVFAILFLLRIKVINMIKAVIVILTIIPGIAYLSIYQKPDVRFTASEWIYKNIPANSFILSETANVVDIPIPPPNYKLPITNYRTLSFNFYDVDSDLVLQEKLYQYIVKADYIFVPSRRIFKNHSCPKNNQIPNSKSPTNFQFPISNFQKEKCHYLRKNYPLLNDYYEKLFSEKLRFKKMAEFASYPKISFFGRTIIEFSDEDAEETWTVFDHPVIRIFVKDHP